MAGWPWNPQAEGFRVVVGYQPLFSEESDAGEADLLGYLDGVMLLLEVKSGFIRSTLHEVWLHRTNTLRKAARQLERKQSAVLQALQADSDLRARLGLSEHDSISALHARVVVRSIELDGEVVDGFSALSCEVIEAALRDEQYYLRAFDQEEEKELASLYPHGVSARALVQIIEHSRFGRNCFNDLYLAETYSRAPPELHVQRLGGISKMPNRRDQARLAFSIVWRIR